MIYITEVCFPKHYTLLVTQINRLTLYCTWLVALSAMFGSLYFSEILKFPPCVLCWYQRIFMYPLVLLIPIGIIKKDKNLPVYGLSLSLVGSIIAFFHVLLQIGIIKESLIPCSNGVSCTTEYLNLFGFLSIPLMSLLAFIFITLAMIFIIKTTKHA